ncbi:hypothetical protein CF641_38425, partial [Burkholderia pseudomallei]
MRRVAAPAIRYDRKVPGMRESAGAFGVGTDRRRASVECVAVYETTWKVWAALWNGGCRTLATGDAASDPQALLSWLRAQEMEVDLLENPLDELAYATG